MADSKDNSGVMEVVAIAALAFFLWWLTRKKVIYIGEPSTTESEVKDEFATDPDFNMNEYCQNVIYRPLSTNSLITSNLLGEGWCFRGDRSAIDESKGFGDAYAEEQAKKYADMKQAEAILIKNKLCVQFRLINSTASPITTNVLNTTSDNKPFEIAFDPPVDSDGIITIDVSGRGYKLLPEIPYTHGSIYYNGYIYASSRATMAPDHLCKILKINALDYNDKKYITIRLSSEVDTAEISYVEPLQLVGNYIYALGYSTSALAKYVLIQFNITTEDYKIFKLPTNYGMFAIPLIADSTHFYISYNIPGGDPDYYNNFYLLKYLISDFENPSWDKFNVIGYGDGGVPVVPVANIEIILNSYCAMHAGISDSNYVYLSFLGSIVEAGKFFKVEKSSMTIVDSIDIPSCSDDIAQTNTHVFLGVESFPGDYGSTWGVVAVKKSDLTLTKLLPHSTEPVNLMSYGVQILNISGVDYLFDLRRNGKINIWSIVNVDTWSDAGSSDAESERILSFVYTAGSHEISNEIIIDSTETIHNFLWGTSTELIKYKLTGL